MNPEEIYANKHYQEQKPRKAIRPFVSLISGILATALFFCPYYFTLWAWLMFSLIGFSCGLNYLIKAKKGTPLERICAILGTSLSGVWLCIIFIK